MVEEDGRTQARIETELSRMLVNDAPGQLSCLQ